MKNTEVLDRLDEANRVQISKLYWIAGSIENEELDELLGEMDNSTWEKLFPEIHSHPLFRFHQKMESFLMLLLDFKKLGFLAMLSIPECTNFTYKDGEPSSWRVNAGISRLEYVYAETTDELLMEIEKCSKEVFQEYVKKDQLKQQKNQDGKI